MTRKTIRRLVRAVVLLATIGAAFIAEVRGAGDKQEIRTTYKGREAGACWRKAAAERIDRLRKADLHIRIIGADGAPAKGVAVEVRMLRQAFPFASAVSSRVLVRQQGPDADCYRDMVDRLFTHVTLEYESCQVPWERDPQVAIDSLRWLRDRGKHVHGCHIIWPHIPDGLSKHIVAAKARPDEVRRLTMAHVDEKLAACKGFVREWNVLNELHTSRFFEESLGEEAGKALVVDIFRRARQLDPTLRLGINDFGDMANPSQAHIDGYLAWIRYLKNRKAPVDVVGLQCHFCELLRSPDDCMSMLDRFAALGYPLHATELDVNISDETLQADYLRDIMTVLYSHPAVEKITLWGFWEGRHWLPKAALWRKDWSIKPSGQAWMDLVLRDWRTNVALTTDATGTVAARAFHGDYEVTATLNGKTVVRKVSVTSNGSDVEMRMPR